MLDINWLRPECPSQWVRDVLRLEAPDIPASKLEGVWVQRTFPILELSVDEVMVAGHDADSEHQRRRDGFVEAFRSQGAVPPLIVLGVDLFLVDGYARLRAARLLGVREVQVLLRYVGPGRS